MVNVVYTGSDAFVTCTPNHVLVVSPPSWNTNVVVFLSSRCVSSLTKLSQWIVKNNKKLKSRMLNFQLRILAEIVHHIFGPWITWNSGIAAAPFNPNRRLLFTVYVAFEPLSPRNKSTVLYNYYKPRSKHRAITVKLFYFRSQNISFTPRAK